MTIEITSTVDITNAQTAELVEWYNENVDGPQIKKFSDRATAERRVTMLWEAIQGEPKKPAKGKGKKPAEPTEERGAAIAASWQDPAVAAKRKQRSAVHVTGKGIDQQFSSVGKAFRELDLPSKKDIRFRMKLKEAGELEEFGYKWKIIPLNY